MLSRAEAKLETTAERIARIMAHRYGIRVRVQGAQACVDPRTQTIYLPALNTIQTRALGQCYDGFLDHEVAHLRYTDFGVLDECLKDLRLKQVWNAVEDRFVERRMSAEFVGCAENLGHLRSAMHQDFLNQPQVSAASRWIWAVIRCLGNEAQVQDYAGDSEIYPRLAVLDSELEAGRRAMSSAECLDVARRILAKIDQVSPEQKSGSSEQSGSESGSESGDDEKDQVPDSGSEKDETGDEGEGTGDTGDAEDGQPDEDGADNGTGQGSGDDDADDGDGDGAGDGQAESESAESGEPDALSGDPGAAEESGTWTAQELAEARADVEGWLSSHIPRAESAGTGEPTEYLVFSTAYDEETRPRVEPRDGEDYRQLCAEAKPAVGALAQMLEVALLSSAECRWVPGAPRGRRTDRRAVARWAARASDSMLLWKRRELGERLETAVCVLVDVSGSMGWNTRQPGDRSKSHLAAVAACALHEALTRAQVAHCILSFSTGNRSRELSKDVSQARVQGQDLTQFSRVDELNDHRVLVEWGESTGSRLAQITGRASNRDGESVLWAARRLAARPETRKVLVVLSDGQPAGALYHYLEQQYLREVVSQTQEAGIEVYGIGIQDESVRHYYPQWTVVRRVNDLPAVLLREVGNLLLNQKGTCHGSGTLRTSAVIGAGA